jgi:hypothetical protein
MKIKLLNNEEDFKSIYACAFKGLNDFWFYNDEIRNRNMPKEFPCVIVIFSEYMGYMCGYIPLYAVHYLEKNVDKNTFDKDLYLKNFIKRTNYGRPFVNQWTPSNLDVTALMEWKWESLHRVKKQEQQPLSAEENHIKTLFNSIGK